MATLNDEKKKLRKKSNASHLADANPCQTIRPQNKWLLLIFVSVDFLKNSKSHYELTKTHIIVIHIGWFRRCRFRYGASLAASRRRCTWCMSAILTASCVEEKSSPKNIQFLFCVSYFISCNPIEKKNK